MSEPVVELREVWKLFGSVRAVQDCSFSVESGEFVSLLGPSGSGKTTTLRLIAGFERLSAGQIRIAGRDVSRVAPKDRNVSMVFQNYALFPHMTVFDNVAFGLTLRRIGKTVVRERVAEYLALVRLEGYEERSPSQLSGGQQQRVALARALITEPAVLLLDEPLGALDRKLREELQLELKDLLARLGMTTVYVTHDQDEALVMSDRVAVMNNGMIEQLDRPDDLYERPQTRFVASFVGTSTIFEGRVGREGDSPVLATGDLVLPLPGGFGFEGRTVAVAIRPEKVRLRSAAAGEGNLAKGRVTAARYRGASTLYELELAGGRRISASVANTDLGSSFRPGEPVVVEFPQQHLHLLEVEPAGASGSLPEPASEEVGTPS